MSVMGEMRDALERAVAKSARAYEFNANSYTFDAWQACHRALVAVTRDPRGVHWIAARMSEVRS